MTLKRSQTTSKEFSSFKNVLPASPNKRLQLKLTNTYKTLTKYSHNIKFLGHGSNNTRQVVKQAGKLDRYIIQH